MEKMKYYTVVLDGIDKTGKDTIAGFIWRLDKRLNILVRGWPSLVVYNEKFKRNTDYAMPYKDALYVHLLVDEEDWKIRCSMTNEKKIDYEADSKMFDSAFNILDNYGYKVMTANTSRITPYQIAQAIVEVIKQLNYEEA